jgi:hypothetical protein
MKIVKVDPIRHIVTIETAEGLKCITIPPEARGSTAAKQSYIKLQLQPRLTIWQRLKSWVT